MATKKTKPQSVESNMRRSVIYMQGEPDTVFKGVAASSSMSPDEVKHSCAALFDTIENYFHLVAETLSDEPELQKEALERLQRAKRLLENRNEFEIPAQALSEAQFDVHMVHVKIARVQELRDAEHRFRWIVPSIVVIYLAGIIATLMLSTDLSMASAIIPVLEIPVSVLLWAAVGSLAAILWRFYKQKLAVGGINKEIRWLIARPVIGIIMGSITYLAIASGVGLFNSAQGPDEMQNANLLLVVAFLGGFSDRFFEAILDLVVGQVTGKEMSITDINGDAEVGEASES